MVTLITLFGRPLSELRHNDLRRERRCHKYLLTKVKEILKFERKAYERYPSKIREDKVAFFEMYQAHLESLIEEIDYYLDRRLEPTSNATWVKPVGQIRKENKERRKRQINDNTYAYDWEHRAEVVGWDRDVFFSIAYDRGYQTEEAVISEVSEELSFSRTKTKLMLDKGRFTWGQVLCLGAMLQMTPKEFCDTFLAGYFVDEYGDYRASYENLNKRELLKKAMRSDPLFGIEKTEIEVGADGRPLDEDTWFD